MTFADPNALAVEVMRLQNKYAYAIDTRDWESFRTVFTPDVIADYADRLYFEGMDDWLENFIPFHDGCSWTVHMMMGHVAGHDADGTWGTCYGFVQWKLEQSPDLLNIALVLFRDRLAIHEGSLRISRRRLEILMSQTVSVAEGQGFPTSIFRSLTPPRET